jgi:riboflavin biosynthesis pyrimidine reductase
MLKGLVDELHILISPVLLGGGTPIFQGKPAVCLRLLSTGTWKESGIVLARYAVDNDPSEQ